MKKESKENAAKCKGKVREYRECAWGLWVEREGSGRSGFFFSRV